MIKYIWRCLLIGILLFACNSYKKCIELQEKAFDNLSQFYYTTDSLYLYEAKTYLDSIKCVSYQHTMIYYTTKIEILSLLNEYTEIVKYIQTMDITDFDKEYKRSVNLKYFEAKLYESKGDTLKRDILYWESIKEIQSYLNINSDDFEALSGLFMIKRMVCSEKELLESLEYFRKTGLYNDNWLNKIEEMIGSENNSSANMIDTTDKIEYEFPEVILQ